MMNNIKEINDKLLSSSYEEVLKSSSDYDTFLLLSPLRSNCLSAIPFSKDDEVLLMGGNGVIVNFLLDKVKHIDILEDRKDTQENIKILAKLNQNYSFCLDIYNKNYSKIIIFGDYLPMLKEDLDELLKRLKGNIYLFINNKFGLSRFSGDKEKTYFESIVGQEKSCASKSELEEILRKNNLKGFFYYPFPNYYFSDCIYSSSYLPNESSINKVLVNYKERILFFDEEKAFINVIKSGDFETFSNSFLLEITK